ncbi:uncharacterized protein [Diadema antillarum]|uniref:uncharacterized protein n=1 Tax=Diadema antillarum TaxID=105358 RepID=UPI003A8AD83A
MAEKKSIFLQALGGIMLFANIALTMEASLNQSGFSNPKNDPSYFQLPPTSSSKNESSVRSCEIDFYQMLVDCSKCNLTSVPRDIPSETEILYLSYNLIVRLENDTFSGLPKLRELYVDTNMLSSIESSALEGLHGLEILDLSGNSLSSLPADLFIGITELMELNLGINYFDEIPCESLLPLTGLKRLLLHFNHIKYPYCERFPTLSNATAISLSRNGIWLIQRRTFRFLENSTVHHLILTGNEIKYIDYRVVASLRFHTLTLNSNPFSDDQLGIASIFYGAKFNTHLRALHLRDTGMNAVPSVLYVFLANKTLDFLDISMNDMSHIPSDTINRLTMLRNISLADNLLEQIDPANFSQMEGLLEMNLENNVIARLDSLRAKTGWNMSRLLVLNLAGNRLYRLPGNAFLGLEGLETLVLRSNPINYMEAQAFDGLVGLTSLDLSYTDITNVLWSTFQSVPNLLSLNFSHAKLVQASPREFLKGIDRLQKINLAGNDLRAMDMWNHYFEVSLFSRKTDLKEIWLDDNPKLGDIPARTFENLTSLSMLSFNNCGIKRLDANLFSDLSNLSILSFDKNRISELHPTIFSALESLRSISAAGNALTIFSSPIFRQATPLENINVPFNAITSIDSDSLDNLSELDTFNLEGNPLSCTCAFMPFHDWLKETNVTLLGVVNTLCSSTSFPELIGRSVALFSPSNYCGPNIALYASLPACAVLLAIAMALTYYNRYWIRYHLFLLRLHVFGFAALEDERDAADYEYHLNIMFTDDDREWVNAMLKPALRENLPDYHEHIDIIFGDDDLIPGMYYLSAIDHAIVNSYKTILLLSNAAIRDDWFTSKFRLALEHVNNVKVEKVIIVFLEEFANEDLPFLIKAFLSKNKPHLKWTDDERGRRYFWEELWKNLKCNLVCDNRIPT